MSNPPALILGYQRPSGPAPRPLAGTVVAMLGVFIAAVGVGLTLFCIGGIAINARNIGSAGATMMLLGLLSPTIFGGIVLTIVGIRWCRAGLRMFRGDSLSVDV